MASVVRITGAVQGVGFRPHVFRQARTAGYRGWVANSPEGVLIHLELDPEEAKAAVAVLLEQLPRSARVETVSITKAGSERLEGFEIRPSLLGASASAEILCDLAMCAACREEILDPGNRRYGYAYTSCTDCGPRYSVMTSLPYDRGNTTLASWPMCLECEAEYTNPLDRRFHAEPIGCPSCGPTFWLYLPGKKGGFARSRESGLLAIKGAAELLNEGEVVAVKGIGGYHLACNAADSLAIERLREAKYRKEKPFAVMVPDLETAAAIGHLGEREVALLSSPSAPIVLLRKRLEFAGVAPGSPYIGVMLAYTGVHHLLFESNAPRVVVMTSGNRSSEPIAFEDGDALGRFEGMASAVLCGERPIARRLDDSLAYPFGRAPLLRRSRGLAPAFSADLPWSYPVLGCGADLKGTVALAVAGKVATSQYLGDLGFEETRVAHRRTVTELAGMYGIGLDSCLVCSDLHPDYYTHRYAEELGELTGRAPLFFQHHRAHIASALAESASLNLRVVGIAMDGTGYGDDGTIWGGEFFTGCLEDGLVAAGSLEQGLLLGGDAAARRPLQALGGYLASDECWEMLADRKFAFDRQVLGAVDSMRTERGFSTPASSCGRLFDAMAAICGFVGVASFEGQAATWLESLAELASGGGGYDFPVENGLIGYQLALERAIVDRMAGVDPETISLKFHRGLARAVVEMTVALAKVADAEAAVLSGGVFQNRLLLELVEEGLTGAGLPVITNTRHSCNDENIALGQVVLGAFELATGRHGVDL